MKIIVTQKSNKLIFNQIVRLKQNTTTVKEGKIFLMEKLFKGTFYFTDLFNKPLKIEELINQNIYHMESEELYYYPYIKNNNELLLKVKTTKISPCNFHIGHLKITNSTITIPLKNINNNNKVFDKKFVLIERITKHRINATSQKSKIYFSTEIFQNGIYDLFLSFKYQDDGIETLIRAGKVRIKEKISLKSQQCINQSTTLLINPYATYKKNSLSFNTYQVENENIAAFKIDKNLHHQELWIIGEQPTRAKDNGIEFFKYLRNNHPGFLCYYIIEKDSPDYEVIKELGNVIIFGSKEHFYCLKNATKIITTHHYQYLVPGSNKKLIKQIKAKIIFLQHGVMGTKYMNDFYGRVTNKFHTDLFIVSSKREKEMIINEFKYNKNQVAITGLARFDNLFIKESIIENSILIMPTWRDWLSNSKNFIQTKYFKEYNKLLTILNNNYTDGPINFLLHKNMQPYNEYFSNKYSNINILNYNTVNIQSLLKKHQLLITDYSSVGFDFSFLKKHVIYFQFDQKAFIGKNGSHLDLENELPGEILFNVDDVYKTIQQYQNNNFIQTKENYSKAQNLLLYYDSNNCQRIYQAILEFNYKDNIQDKILKNAFVEDYFINSMTLKFNNSIYYLLIKIITFILSLFPTKDLIIFESGNGRTMDGDPFAIYKQWQKLFPNQKFIYVFEEQINYRYRHNTKQVPINSISYYYYLARAKIVVNNQYFSKHVKLNKDVFYLQTWHGTTIKTIGNNSKLLKNNLELEQLLHDQNRWTYLLSQSPYMTQVFKDSFSTKAEILEIGLPSNDIFFSNIEQIKLNLYRRIGITEQQKVILIAPTYRETGLKTKRDYQQDLYIDFEQLFIDLPNDYIVLIKLHHHAKTKISYKHDRLKRVGYKELNELLLITDILITDYSAALFSGFLANVKTIAYLKDYYEYTTKTHKLILELEQLPCCRAYNQEELTQEILANTHYNYEAINKIYAPHDHGFVTTKLIDLIK